MKRALGIALAAALLAAPCVAAEPPSAPGPKFVTEAKATRAQRGMVAAEHPLAAAAGAELLEAGGNAVDAAAAAAFAIGVVNPASAGIGGGGFLLYFEAATGDLRALDFRERAPAAASRDMYLRKGQVVPELSRTGGLAVGVPGEVAGLAAAVARHGKKSLAEVLAPAIRLAEQGFPLGRHMAATLEGMSDTLAQRPLLGLIFKNSSGRLLREGETLKRPGLAKTLRAIAQHGPAAFYRGPLAAQIVDTIRREGGILSTEDLANYEATWRDPVQASYRDHLVVGFPPPSSGGGVLVEILNVLAGWKLRDFDPRSADARHLLAEAERLAFADRALHYGDPDFHRVPLDRLLSERHTQALRAKIDLRRAGAASAGPVVLDQSGTSHLSVVDAEGNAVALTSTINTSFGSEVVPAGTGIILNDEMDDFAAAPGVPNVYGLVGTEANAIRPGKRPLSSMSPTIVLRDGKVRLVVGGSGGPRIITATLAVILGVVDFGLPLVDAVAFPRIHHQWKPHRIYHEPGLGTAVALELGARGHDLHEVAGLAAVQAVEVAEDGTRIGVADPRKGGGAVGW